MATRVEDVDGIPSGLLFTCRIEVLDSSKPEPDTGVQDAGDDAEALLVGVHPRLEVA